MIFPAPLVIRQKAETENNYIFEVGGAMSRTSLTVRGIPCELNIEPELQLGNVSTGVFLKLLVSDWIQISLGEGNSSWKMDKQKKVISTLNDVIEDTRSSPSKAHFVENGVVHHIAFVYGSFIIRDKNWRKFEKIYIFSPLILESGGMTYHEYSAKYIINILNKIWNDCKLDRSYTEYALDSRRNHIALLNDV